MRYKLRFVLLTFCLLLLFPIVAHADATNTSQLAFSNAFIYTAGDESVSFRVPEGWERVPSLEADDIGLIVFQSKYEEGAISYISTDVWDALIKHEKKGVTRADINQNYFTTEDIAAFINAKAEDVRIKTYSGTEYFTAPVMSFEEIDGEYTTILHYFAIHIRNGIIHCFIFTGDKDSDGYKSFKTVMASAVYTDGLITSTDDGQLRKTSERFWDSSSSITSYDDSQLPAKIFISLILTIIVYTVPILIYRHLIRKAPCNKKSAKKITIIYAVIMFFAVSIFYFLMNVDHTASAAAVMVWSYVNYRILIGDSNQYADTSYSVSSGELSGSTEISSGIKSDKTDISSDVLSTDIKDPQLIMEVEAANKHSNMDESEILPIINTPTNDADDTDMTRSEPEGQSVKTFCHMCGVPLPDHARFCNRCGVKL